VILARKSENSIKIFKFEKSASRKIIKTIRKNPRNKTETLEIPIKI